MAPGFAVGTAVPAAGLVDPGVVVAPPGAGVAAVPQAIANPRANNEGRDTLALGLLNQCCSITRPP